MKNIKPNSVKKRLNKHVSWTREEDLLICSYVDKYGSKWNKITNLLPNRGARAIRGRWDRLQMMKDSNVLQDELACFYKHMSNSC